MARGRLIDKSIYTNLDLADIEPQARYLYIGMIVHADDRGRMKADPRFLKALIFPFDQATRIDSIKSWRDQLVSKKLITLYAADGREYLYHPNWEKWQPLRSDRDKSTDCPEPDTAKGVKDIGIPMTDNGIPMTDNGIPMVNQCPPIPNLTEPNLTEPKKTIAATKIKINFDVSSNKFLGVNGKLDIFKEKFPAVNVDAEILKMEAWLMSHPKNRKSNYEKFITNWLSRCQDRAPAMHQQETIKDRHKRETEETKRRLGL